MSASPASSGPASGSKRRKGMPALTFIGSPSAPTTPTTGPHQPPAALPVAPLFVPSAGATPLAAPVPTAQWDLARDQAYADLSVRCTVVTGNFVLADTALRRANHELRNHQRALALARAEIARLTGAPEPTPPAQPESSAPQPDPSPQPGLPSALAVATPRMTTLTNTASREAVRALPGPRVSASPPPPSAVHTLSAQRSVSPAVSSGRTDSIDRAPPSMSPGRLEHWTAQLRGARFERTPPSPPGASRSPLSPRLPGYTSPDLASHHDSPDGRTGSDSN
jgi:hypothetical protein